MARVFTITEGLENMGALKTGGQGSVYKARRIGEIISAVKLLPTPIYSETIDDKHFTDFQNEVNKLKKVNQDPNPNVVKIISSGITDTGNFPFIEMEFIEGPDLEELLKSPHDPVFTIKEIIKVAEHLSNALSHCHKADVKHGDVKSNNVKFNIHSGNYILLDFGMAMMSDEQRRTSLRQAGAIEFMAPEQNEGKMLFQTDIYSFGIILYELVAGIVPFPLSDRGETSRNKVMVAHMESPVPDLLALRRQHLPASWPNDKKDREMQVPEWLLRMIDKCLEKKPDNRFVNGTELHNFVVYHSTSPASYNQVATEALKTLEKETIKLRKENEELHRSLLKYQQSRTPVQNTQVPPHDQHKKSSSGKWLWFLLIALALAFIAYTFIRSEPVDNNKQVKEETPATASQPVKPRTVIGQYKVQVARAYFHNEPDPSSRRGAYLIPSNDVITALDEKNGFIYTEFTNNKGQTSKGWVDKTDLVTLDEWHRQDSAQQAVRLKQEDINSQLQDARNFLANNEIKEALYIYDYLAQQDVPEAMYQWGNLALQRKNDAIDCKEGWNWIQKASDKGYVAAKRTLGFLYLFADSDEILKINDYDNCQYERNVFKGTRLLTEAMFSGDTTAKRLLDELNIRKKDSTEAQVQQ
ncbi:MAG TPA: protein kinase [Flavisolibacter sp.]|nr:protein kinase [Flavisolibacter sp.]